MFHTVYNSYETKPNGRDYIGKHSTDDLDDGYLGSYKDKIFNPDSKIAFAYAKTAEGAIWLEMQFQRVFKVVEDPQFANKAYQTATKFDNTGNSHSEETKEKMSKIRKGRPLSKEHSRNISKAKTGKTLKPLTEEHKDKLRKVIRSRETIEKTSRANTGKTRTEASKKRLSECKIGEKNPFFGKVHTEETRNKMREKQIGLKWWVDESGKTCQSQECPGPGWQPGRKWKL